MKVIILSVIRQSGPNNAGANLIDWECISQVVHSSYISASLNDASIVGVVS